MLKYLPKLICDIEYGGRCIFCIAFNEQGLLAGLEMLLCPPGTAAK
jgi:hypothetical protein